MENQHRKIKGYKELNQAEIDMMNKVKEKAAEVGELVEEIFAASSQAKPGEGPDGRWASIAQTQLQQGFMALTRSIAKPNFF